MRDDAGRTSLRAVLFADLVDFSRLVASNELATLDFVDRCFGIFRHHCAGFGGEFIKTTGDGVLVLFDSASNALEYAVTVQAMISALAQHEGVTGRFRVGVHLGEVHLRGVDAFGHTINLAARLQQHAEPGGVCVSQDVYWATRGTSPYRFRYFGRPVLKNMPRPVSLYHVVASDDSASTVPGGQFAVAVIDGLMIRNDLGESFLPRSRRLQALIGYLALSSDQQDSASRIAALIWSDRSLAKARQALARCLRLVTQTSPSRLGDLLAQQDSIVAMNRASVSVDIVRILETLREGRVEDFLLWRSDWTGSILLGYEDTSTLFNAWLSVTRHGWRDRIIEALEAVLDRYDAGEPGLARAASALLNLDASHERAAQCLIRHHEAAGNPAAGMRVYGRLCDVLRDRFGIEPTEETRRLEANLAGRTVGSEKAATRRPGTRAPGIAVSGFSAPADHILHAAGFRSELIANLSKFRDWVVLETREGHEPPEADYILSARCADRDGGVRLIVALSDNRTRRIIWSERFDLTLGNWFEVQKQVVGRIASTLEIYLSHDRLSRIQHRSVHDLGAYDAWLHGEDLLTRWSHQAEDEAEALFERVIAEDPGFAPAYASLASIYNSRHFIRPGIALEAHGPAEALRLARRAVELDPMDARSHLVVAWSNAMTRGFEQSELHYGLATDLNPNSPKTLISASLGLAFAGRADLAADILRQAMTLTSMFLDYQWSHIATIRYFVGDFRGAVEAADLSNNLIIDTPGWRAAALQRLGRETEARAAIEQLQSTVASRWVGPSPATGEAVLDWFLTAFPIKRDDIIADLAALRQLC